jgi:replicative DNA helicase
MCSRLASVNEDMPSGAASSAGAADPTAPPAERQWRVDAPTGSMAPRSARDVIAELDDRVLSGRVSAYEPIPLGFMPLDRALGGGVRPGELVLVGGAQGTGKTTMALQMARNVALAGDASVLYLCFEHEEDYLVNRLVAMESLLANLPNITEAVKIQDVRREILGTGRGASKAIPMSGSQLLGPALEQLVRYEDRLFLLRGSQTAATVENIRELVRSHQRLDPKRRLLLFVDYLQKVPQIPEPATEEEKVTFVVNGLKDVALSEGIPVIAIVAADKEGLKASRLRNHHLRGSSAINYEADVILILNEKYHIVAKVNIEFNPYQAQRFRDWIIVTLEKNRGGVDNLDLEFEKHFAYAAFDPEGRPVQEKLIEERLYND